MKTKILVGVGLTAATLAFAAKDAVIMTVNGVDVPQSEFEYLYNKNRQQQLNPQTIDEYADMFKLYKLKVADARAEGLDTLSSFRREMAQYRHDLAAPYINDSVFINNLVKEAYDRAGEEVEAIHVMLFKTPNPVKNAELRQRADSLAGVLKAGADFADIAARFSGDRGSNSKGGYMGYITAQQYPYAFEEAAYSLREGEISDVVESPVGYHILKGGKHRKPRGKILAEHILVMSSESDAADSKTSARRLIDSIYSVAAANPAAFEDLAIKYSDDKGSGAQGGKLPWFGTGEMVQEFDSVAFAMPTGTISEPFKTRFGWHIIKKLDAKSIPAFSEFKPLVLASMDSPQDPRFQKIRAHQIARLAKKHKATLNNSTVDALKKDLASNDIDSAFYARWTKAPLRDMEFCVIDGRKIPMSSFIERMEGRKMAGGPGIDQFIDRSVDYLYLMLLSEAEEEQMLAKEPDYANLYREYVDGSLLYEVSVRKVWDKAVKDEEGLKKYFAEHSGEYKWSEPRAKGYLVQAVNDSVADAVRQRAASLGRDTLVNTIRREFPKVVSISKVLEPKGGNAMVDNLLFGGPAAKTSSANYKTYFMLDPRVIDVPEELADVKGLVTSDYQAVLQKAWEDELLKKYPVTVNEKVLKKIKPKK